MKKYLIILMVLFSTSAWASAPTRQNTYTAGQVISPTDVMANENAIFTYLQNGVDTYAPNSITGAALSSVAGISYSQLNLSNSILNSDISSATTIDYTKLNLTAKVKNSDFAQTGGVVPQGGIIMWSGTISTIPNGWNLCDGTNGTPNLTNRFIVGADADSGGVAKSTITGVPLQTSDTGVMPSHDHGLGGLSVLTTSGGASVAVSEGNAYNNRYNTLSAAGTGTKNIAVFYALAFIQKL